MARAERMLRDEQIAARGRDVQPAHPRRRRAVGDVDARAHVGRRARASGCRGSSASSASIVDRARRRHARCAARRPTRTRPGSRATTRPRPCTSSSSGSRRRRSRRSRSGPVRVVVDHPEYHQDVVLSTGAARGARGRPPRSHVTSPRLMQHPRSGGSIPTSRCPARAAPGDAGYDLCARDRRAARAARRARARADRSSRSRSPRATPGSCSRVRGSRCGTA